MTDEQIRPLFGEKFAPITSSIGFLNASLEEASEALRAWRAKIHGTASLERLPGGLRENIARLEPLIVGAHPRELIVATGNPEWSALFDCGAQGGDPVSTIGFLSRTAQLQGLVVRWVPDSPGDAERPERPGAVQFELFGPLPTHFLNYVRTLSVIRDGKRWRFDATGTVQAFEDTAAYSRRRARDRFTPEMLRDYARALGLRPFDDDFYPGPSVLVRNPSSSAPGYSPLSIAEAQRRIGIVQTEQ